MQALPLLLGSLAAFNVQSGTLEPALEAAIADMSPADKVDVIIRCTDAVTPADIVAADSATQRKALIKALRTKSTLCTKLVAKNRASDETENETELWLINAVAATVKVAKLDSMAKRKGVESIGLNAEVLLQDDPPAPVPSGQPGDPSYTFWNLSETRITDLWAMGYWGQGIVVGTMDTGVDPDHADLGPNWRGGTNSWFDPNGEHPTIPYDADGHGTGVMGVILGGNSTGLDIGAAPGAQWIAAKIFDDAGASDIAKIHQGFQWMLDPDGDPATDDAPDIVNNSWALSNTVGLCDGEFAIDIEILKAADVAVVFAAGNYGPAVGSSVEPGNNPGSLSVGAVDFYQDVLFQSSRGPSACDGGVFPSLVAPGKDIFTAGLTGGGSDPSAWAYLTGTSIAAPHVTGAIAVLMSAVPDATVAQLDAAIQAGALDLGASGPDNDSGAGYLDAVEAYLLLATGAPTDVDGDGVSDDLDQCPNTPAGAFVDRNGCSASQLDRDGDGVSDALDQCPNTPAGESVDANGCSAIQLDADGDGVSVALDQCPSTPAGEPVDVDGCAASQLDGDRDRVSDALDHCPNTPSGEPVAANGCSANERPLFFSTRWNTATVPGVAAPYNNANIYGYDGSVYSGFLYWIATTGFQAEMDGLQVVDADTFYVSFSNETRSVPGVGTVQDEDVLLYDAGAWSVYFDGTAQGLTADGHDIDAFSIDGGVLYFSTLGDQDVGGLGAGDDADIYRWDGTAFARVFDASALGALSLPAYADIDGLTVRGGTYYLSFLGGGAAQVQYVPGLGMVNDEAVVSFDGASWSLYSSSPGLDTTDGQDVDALDLP